MKSIPVYYEEYRTGIPLLVLHGYSADHHFTVAGIELLFKNCQGWRLIYP